MAMGMGTVAAGAETEEAELLAVTHAEGRIVGIRVEVQPRLNATPIAIHASRFMRFLFCEREVILTG